MRLTSQIKELGAILQKLIKYEPGLIQIDDNNEHLALMAMRMNLGQKTSVVGSVQQRNETKLFFHKNWKK
jgi:hypothetical protein